MHAHLKKLIHFCYYLLIFITPLLMSNQTSEMFEFPKILTIYIIASTTLALWVIDSIIYRRRVRLPSLAISLGVFLASQMLSTVTSVDVHTSIFGYYGRFTGGLLSVLAYSVLFFVAYQTFDAGTFRTLLKVSLISSIVVLFWGLPGRLLGVDMSCILFRGEFSTSCWTNEFRPQERMFSTLGQPNWLGVYLTMHVFIGLFLWITRGSSIRIKHSILYPVYILLMSLGVVFTGSRSSEIGLLGGVIGLPLIYYWNRGKRIQTVMVASCLLIVGILYGAWTGYRLLNVSTDKITHSGTIRLIVWEGALKLVARYPLTGTGPETFAYTYFLTRPEAHNHTTEKDLIYNKAHNEFLNFLATTGIVGFLAYVLMICMMIRGLLRTSEGSILACGIFAMSVAHFFGFSTTTGQLLLFLIPVYGIISQDNHPEQRKSGIFPWAHALVIALVFGGWVMTMRYFYDYYQADLAYARANSLQYSQAYIESIEAFSNALSHRFEHIYADKFALTIAQTAYLLAQADTDKQYDTQIQSYITMAQELQNAAIHYSPQNPMYWKDRVRMYQLIEGVVSEKDKKNVALQIKTAIAQATKLAPTDLEVREMMKSNNKQ